jgi:hypothetical protein
MPKQRNYRKRAASSESELSGEELEKTRYGDQSSRALG